MRITLYNAPPIQGKSILHTFMICLLLISGSAFSEESSRFLLSQRHGDNIRLLGLSGAGVAIPADISSNLINPSLYHAWHVRNETKIMGTINYMNTPYYNSGIVNTGMSFYANKKLSGGALYSLYKKNEHESTNRVTITAGGEMFEGDTDQGPVYMGFNLKYSNMQWRAPRRSEYNIDSIGVYRDTVFYDSTIISRYTSDTLYSFRTQNSVSLDLGLYQARVTPFLEFGIVFHNIMGYSWFEKSLIRNDFSASDTAEAYRDTVILRDSSGVEYSEEESSDKWKPRKREKWMTVGIALNKTLMSGELNTIIPFDLELLNIFDRNRRVNWGFRTGIELKYKSLSARFGYSRVPSEKLSEDGHNIENKNSFYGGTGVKFKNISFDISFSKNEWGANFAVFPGAKEKDPPPPPETGKKPPKKE